MNTSDETKIRRWLSHPLPADVAAAIGRLAKADDVQHLAIMPDVHLSHEVCVGCVLATSQLIYPNAVGGDIGCGMAAIAFDSDAKAIADETSAARILMNLPTYVPAMRHARGGRLGRLRGDLKTTNAESEAYPRLGPCAEEPESSEDLRLGISERLEVGNSSTSKNREIASLSHPKLESIRRRDGVVQLGTLGRGNHFLEFQCDDDDRLWLMVHSGSRAIGPAVRDWHLQFATSTNTGLRHLDAESPAGQAYLADADWARRFASANRRAMIDAAATMIRQFFSINAIDDSYFDCDHNHVRRETHFGRKLWVHRKGAARAGLDERGIIPGSMGSESFHVVGRECDTALHSSSHGAGRIMSRTEARQKIAGRDLHRQLKGVWYDPRIADALREEAPSAYKDIGEVMRAQHELTRIVRRLRPVICYKSG